jgi:glycosyltransferase involved in cell wall biosynthesis
VISLIVPAYNEERNIVQAVEDFYGTNVVDQVIVVDNNSTDRTSEVAAQLGVSRAWVRDHATRRNPRLPVVRFGGKRAILRFRPQDVQQFIDQHLLVEGGV